MLKRGVSVFLGRRRQYRRLVQGGVYAIHNHLQTVVGEKRQRVPIREYHFPFGDHRAHEMLDRLDSHHPGDRLVEQRRRVIPTHRFDHELRGLRRCAVGGRIRMCNGTRSTVRTMSPQRREALHDDVFEIAAVRRVRDGHADTTTQRHDPLG